MSQQTARVQVGGPELIQRTAAERDLGLKAFGVCPTCRKTDGYANVRKLHIFFCREHKVRWRVGINLFSSWKDQTEDEQRHIYETVGLGGFAEIEPYMSAEAQHLGIGLAILYELPED